MTLDGGLRLALPADASALARLHAEAFAIPWDAKSILVLLGQSGVFGVRHNDGFLLCRVVLDEAEILTLAVRPAARRSGLASRLIKAATGLAAGHGAERVFLEVADDNVGAKALYVRMGFGPIGRRKAYYARDAGSLVDGLLLSLKLDERLPTD